MSEFLPKIIDTFKRIPQPQINALMLWAQRWPGTYVRALDKGDVERLKECRAILEAFPSDRLARRFPILDFPSLWLPTKRHLDLFKSWGWVLTRVVRLEDIHRLAASDFAASGTRSMEGKGMTVRKTQHDSEDQR
jgi:hypothetical protein